MASDDIGGVHYQRVKIGLGADGAATDAVGGSGVVSSGVQRVVLATDVALPAGTNAIGKLAANSGVDIGDVDVTSIIPGTSATNLGKAEDDPHTTGDVGVMMLTVRKNTAAATSGSDGDYQPPITDTNGKMWVNASGETLTVGTHAVTISSGGVASGAIASGAVASGAFASGSIGSGAIASGAIASGAVASGAVASGAFASGSISAGAIAAGAASFVKLEDVASADADAGVPAMAIRKATPANTSGTDGDYEMLQMSGGRLWVDASGVSLTAVGDVAHDGIDSGNPVKVAGQARTTNPTAVADADRVNFIADKLGKQIVVPAIRDLKGVQNTTITSSTAETTVVTAVASTFLDVYGVICANSSASACKVTFKDATAGTTRFVIEVPATETRGFMLDAGSAVPQSAVNNNWTATCGTSVADMLISVFYVKNI